MLFKFIDVFNNNSTTFYHTKFAHMNGHWKVYDPN